MNSYSPEEHIRLMRFDFHPTTEGWSVSEVNSDVPGGLAEASVLPRLAQKYFPFHEPHGHVARSLLEAFQKRTRPGARIAFVHATSYADDRQVMQFLGDYFEQNGYRSLYAAPDHLIWREHQAVSLIQGEEGPVGGIVRFYPLEWLPNLSRRTDWGGYYDTHTPSCNHPMAVLPSPNGCLLYGMSWGLSFLPGEPCCLKPALPGTVIWGRDGFTNRRWAVWGKVFQSGRR